MEHTELAPIHMASANARMYCATCSQHLSAAIYGPDQYQTGHEGQITVLSSGGSERAAANK